MNTVTLDTNDAISSPPSSSSIGWLRAHVDYARGRLPLYGLDSVDDLQADTARLLNLLKGNLLAVTQRPAQPGELCTCGRPAVIVFLTGRWGPTGWCGISDGGADGPCVFCHRRAHHSQRCPQYQLRPTAQ